MQNREDRDAVPGKRGTPPKRKVDPSPERPGRKDLKGAAGRGSGQPKHAATRANGLKTSETRKAGPRKIARGTTSRSADK
jgi:hypothetical protein